MHIFFKVLVFVLASIGYWYLSQLHRKSNIFYRKLAQHYTPEDFFQLNLYPNQSELQMQTCKLPVLRFTGHTNFAPDNKPCRMAFDWGALQKNRWKLNPAMLEPFSAQVRCQYRNLTRVTDFKISYSPNASLVDDQLILNEVIEVFCFMNGRLVYDNIHAQIVDKLKDLFPSSSSSSTKLDEAIPEKADKICKPMNILLLSYDSLSRVSWLKRLPRTSEFILNQMNFTMLYGQNIMGDGTPACMVPLLTGKAEEELPSTLKSDPNGQYVDQVYPFIWHSLHKKGKFIFTCN
jgi:hypothetical protein